MFIVLFSLRGWCKKDMNKELKPFRQWHLVKLLGTGAFGEVYHYSNQETGEEVAIKRLKANPKLRPDEISILHKRWLQEYQWMQNLRTKYIVGAVKLKDLNFLHYLTEQNVEFSLPVIVMDYCNGGDLRSHLNKIINLNGLSEHEVRNILHALLRATEYLHEECNIEHRDIKPENIVLHIKGNEKIYKLTDFGYAREIPESTIAQSVVGTRNYVAPEVIDPGVYTKTVDYWSVGVLAYEIICGVHPFMPHQTFVNRMRNIQRKPTQCIAIVQNIDDLSLDHFEFINCLPPQNHLSCIFKKDMENWLKLALDNNYKTRGCVNNELKFYTYLDAVLPKKIVTVFSLKKLKKYFYDIEMYEDVHSFHNKICCDNEINVENIFFIFPPLHPNKVVQKPTDYFVEEWYCDTNNADNPPVMLYVTEFFIKSDCDINCEEYSTISETLKKCMNMSADNENIPLWLLQQFERDVHFILSENQNRLECYLLGIQHFTMEIEHEAFRRKSCVDELVQRSSQLVGRVIHSNFVLNECLKLQITEEALNLANETAGAYTKKCEELVNIAGKLKVSYKEILGKCRELATNNIYEQYAKNDIFELSQYRKFLSLDFSISERMENAQHSIDNCFSEFKKFTKSSEMKNLRASIHEQITNFNLLLQKINNLNLSISKLEEELENFTRSFLSKKTNDKLCLNMNSLHIDGPTSSNNFCSSNDFNMDSKILIDECETICKSMEMFLDMD